MTLVPKKAHFYCNRKAPKVKDRMSPVTLTFPSVWLYFWSIINLHTFLLRFCYIPNNNELGASFEPSGHLFKTNALNRCSRIATNLDVPSRLRLAVSGTASLHAALFASRRTQRVALCRQGLSAFGQWVSQLTPRTASHQHDSTLNYPPSLHSLFVQTETLIVLTTLHKVFWLKRRQCQIKIS